MKANLIVIDDIMLFPVEKPLAVALFNFINQLYEKTAFIITTNKSPSQWAKMLDDEVLATALPGCLSKELLLRVSCWLF